MSCRVCGGTMLGDGHSVVEHCENADEADYYDKEPDAAPVMCRAIPPEAYEVAKEATTCWKCLGNKKCPFAWDPYNTDGDCLADK